MISKDILKIKPKIHILRHIKVGLALKAPNSWKTFSTKLRIVLLSFLVKKSPCSVVALSLQGTCQPERAFPWNTAAAGKARVHETAADGS